MLAFTKMCKEELATICLTISSPIKNRRVCPNERRICHKEVREMAREKERGTLY